MTISSCVWGYVLRVRILQKKTEKHMENEMETGLHLGVYTDCGPASFERDFGFCHE